MYNGLTTADKGALLDAKARGAEWIAREDSSALWGYATKPVNIDLERGFFTWSVNGLSLMLGAIPLDDCKLDFIKWNDAEPVNIDLALAQIAEMESELTANSTPMTWNERINQMSADEKGEFFATFNCIESIQPGYDCSQHENCKECMIAFFASPYTEGETK